MRCLNKPKNKLKLYLKKRLGKTSLCFAVKVGQKGNKNEFKKSCCKAL